MIWPVVLSTGLLLKEPLVSVLDQIKEAGFGTLEIAASTLHLDYHNPDALTQVREKLKALGIKVFSFHAPYKRDVDLTLLDEKGRQKAVKEVMATAEALSLLRGRALVIHGGSEEEGIPEEEVKARLSQARKSLLEMHSYCQKLGLIMVLEDMLAHLLGGKLEHLRWLIRQFPKENTRICLDTGHSFLTKRMLERVSFFGPRLLMAHVHDNNGVYDDHLTPGDGKLPWPELFETFVEIGFEGPLVLEIMGQGDTKESLEDAVRGARFLRNIINRQKQAS